MCVHSTMVSPIHLLLFGAKKVEYVNNMIVMDDWFVVIIKFIAKHGNDIEINTFLLCAGYV